MSQAKKWLGMSPITSQSIQGDTNNAVTAAGTTITTATDLVTTQNIVTTATDSQGVQLDSGIVGDWQMVYNATNVSIKVYPWASAAKINQITAGNAMTLAPQTACQFFVASATQHVAFLSA